jgi:hypothetical protein
MCVLLLEGCRYSKQHSHHRRMKSQGGSDDPSNLLDVYFSCHHEAHHNRDWAHRHGVILTAGDDPAVLVTGCPLDCREDHRV